jgi:hypothetical protein
MRCIRDGQIQSDVVTWELTLRTMGLLDDVRRQIGVIYPSER